MQKSVLLTLFVHIHGIFNLTFDGLFSDLSFNGRGGAQSAPPPIFICENNRKSNKIMHCVEKKII